MEHYEKEEAWLLAIWTAFAHPKYYERYFNLTNETMVELLNRSYWKIEFEDYEN